MNYFLNLPYCVQQNSDSFKLELTFSNRLFSNLPSEPLLPKPTLPLCPSTQAETYAIQLPSIFVLIVASQLQILLTSEYGEYQVAIERYKQSKLKVLLKAGSSYIDYLTPEDVESLRQWSEQVQDRIYFCKRHRK